MIYLVSVIIVLLYFALSVVAFRRWNQSRAVKFFGLTLLFTGIWNLVLIIETTWLEGAPSTSMLNIIQKIDFSVASLVAYCFTLFTLHFPRHSKALSKKIELILAAPIALNLFLTWRGFIFTTVDSIVIDYHLGWYYLYFGIVVMYFIFVSLATLVHKLRNSTGIIRLQIKYILWGYTLSIFVLLYMSIYNAYAEYYSSVDELTFSQIMLVFVASCAYAVLKHRLMGLNYIIRKGTVFTGTLLILMVVYGYLILGFNEYAIERFGWDRRLTYLFSIFLIVITFLPIRSWLTKVLDKLLFPKADPNSKLIEQVRQNVIGSYDIATLVKTIEKSVRKIIDVEARVFIIDKRNRYFYSITNNAKIVLNSPLIQYLHSHHKVIVKEEIQFSIDNLHVVQRQQLEEIHKILDQLNGEIALPLGRVNNLLGIILLPHKEKKEPFTKEEIDLLNRFGEEASEAMENTILYNEALERIGVKVT